MPEERPAAGAGKEVLPKRAEQGYGGKASETIEWHAAKEEARIAALPLIERVFDVENDRPLYVMSNGKRMYRCMTCGEAYIEKQKRKQVGRYCSGKCEEKAKNHWRKAEDALIVLQQQNSRRSWAVSARMDGEGKLPGLCPVCGLPFVPNTGKPGRPRKYCSAKCKKVAYELKWRQAHSGYARRHRFRDCRECGEKFDRTDSRGKRLKVYCSKKCRLRTKGRNRTAKRTEGANASKGGE
jgi:endogenous inhibitor of DNA gyrase (YacG/DUF329 family)